MAETQYDRDVNANEKRQLSGSKIILPRTVYDMRYITEDNRTIFSGLVEDEYDKKKEKPKQEDILTRKPENYPLPLCDDDNIYFEEYLYHPDMDYKRRMLIYGYELLKLYNGADVSWKTTEALAKQLLRKIVVDQSGKPEQKTFGYYWKCVYSNFET